MTFKTKPNQTKPNQTKPNQTKPMTTTDSYKLAHARMYPEGAEFIYFNFTPRSNAYLNIPEKYKTNKVVLFGIQGVIKQMH